jgi:polyisoprenoid-binding protein YceI
MTRGSAPRLAPLARADRVALITLIASAISAAAPAPAQVDSGATLRLEASGKGPAGKVYEAIRGESTLSYRLEHPLHAINGITRDFACTVVLSDDTVTSQVRVSADVRTFDSGNPNRDDHAMEAIRARKHPKVAFASDSVRRAGGFWRVHGKLTFAGQTRPVDFSVFPNREAGRIRITGDFAVRLGDFGVERPSLMFVPARDSLTLRFELVAKDD